MSDKQATEQIAACPFCQSIPLVEGLRFFNSFRCGTGYYGDEPEKMRQSYQCKDRQIASLREQLKAAEERADRCETIIAIAVDHMNTQAREWQVDECKSVFSDAYGLRALAESLWLRSMKREDRLRDKLAAAERDNDRLREAAIKVIEMNRQHAYDQYGDKERAESWSCVVVLRAALLAQPEGAKDGE